MKLAVILFLAAGCSLTPAATLYSTFGPGDTYSSLQDTVGDGHTFHQTWGAMWADPFTVSGAAHVTAYRVAVRGGTSNASFVLSLWSGSVSPTTLVEGNVTSPVLGGTQQILTLGSPSSPALDPGTTYWLVMDATDPVADTLYWYRNDLPGLFRKRALTGGPWGTGFMGSDVFEIQGRSTPLVDSPEPGTALLFAAALAGIAMGRTRRIGS
ncbi:MAG: hypothetical protein JNL62_12655 [Bryobacterales bacterium]|nr:hypothetical protein [Bryobacterales bacterium]